MSDKPLTVEEVVARKLGQPPPKPPSNAKPKSSVARGVTSVSFDLIDVDGVVIANSDNLNDLLERKRMKKGRTIKVHKGA